MLIPMRISLAGGGSDLLPGGAVVSAAIRMYVKVERSWEQPRGFVGRAAAAIGVDGWRVDCPLHGSGLGASSSAVVGMVALAEGLDGKALADRAYSIERSFSSCGWQDHRAAVFNELCIHTEQQSIPLVIDKFDHLLMMFRTGVERDSDTVLSDVRGSAGLKDAALELANVAWETAKELSCGNFLHLAKVFNRSWELKKKLSPLSTTPVIDTMIIKAREAGALGAKLMGAGGGGTLLLFVPPSRQASVRSAMYEYKELPCVFVK